MNNSLLQNAITSYRVKSGIHIHTSLTGLQKYNIIEQLCYNFLSHFLRQAHPIWSKHRTSYMLLQESVNLLCYINIITIKHYMV
jgi:hypothetical protein